MRNVPVAAAICFVLAACSTSGDPAEPRQPASSTTTADGIEYTADTRVMESFPVQLATAVELTNVGTAPVNLTFPDGCVVLLRAYPEGGTTPVWDQARSTGCTMALVELTLGPGESRTFETRTDAREILGDSLPDGRYSIEAYLRPRSGMVEVSAGVVDLAVPRD